MMYTAPSKKPYPRAGDKFLRYFFDDLYAKGEVTECTEDWITVDFGDTITRFPIAACSWVFNASNLSHLMTCEEGELIRDYRDNIRQAETGVEDSDLLDLTKWIV